MMKLFKFEIKKMIKQKKLLWLMFIVLISISYLFQLNVSNENRMIEQAIEKFEPLNMEANQLAESLEKKRIDGNLDELGLQQKEHVQTMRIALYHLMNEITYQNWNMVPIYEGEFLRGLHEFEQAGGQFLALQGVDKEIAIQKNKWLLDYELPYENEKHPTSPHLFLKNTTELLFGIGGVFILLFLFGQTITAELEQRTWLTMQTQPIAKSKQIIAKYVSLLAVLFVYLFLVISVALVIPLIFGEHSLHFQYPQVVMDGNDVVIISTFTYLLRTIGLFICASMIAFSLIFLVSILLKESFFVLIVTFSILLLGLFMTNSNTILQSSFNPFQYFRFTHILMQAPQNMDWLYPIIAIVWSCLFIWLVIFLSKKEIHRLHTNEYSRPFHNGETSKSSHLVWNIFLFEWHKLRRNGRYKQVVILLLFLIVVSFFATTKQVNETEEAYFGQLNEEMINMENGLNFFAENLDHSKKNLALAEADNDEENILIYRESINYDEEIIALYEEYVATINTALIGYHKDDWNSFYEFQLFKNRLYNGDFDSLYFQIDGTSSMGQFSIDASIAEKQWLMERDIQPIFQGEFIPTIHHNWQNNHYEQQKWEEENQRMDNSGLFSLYLLFEKNVYILPVILFFILLGGGFATERGKRMTLHFLQTQPVTNRQIFSGKTLHSIIVAICSNVGLLLFVLLLGTVCNRFGDWDYPILHYDGRGFTDSPTYTGIISDGYGFHFISLGSYLIKSIILFLFVIIFVLVLTNFLSIWMKHLLSVYTTAMLICIGGFVVNNHYLSNIAYLSPFTYFDIHKITNGEKATLLDQSSVNVLSGSLVLLLSTVLLFFIGYLILGRKRT